NPLLKIFSLLELEFREFILKNITSRTTHLCRRSLSLTLTSHPNLVRSLTVVSTHSHLTHNCVVFSHRFVGDDDHQILLLALMVMLT
ncbi:hypothetical protein VIGAN_UM008700, partial [Vigna angularis var. angularis]